MIRNGFEIDIEYEKYSGMTPFRVIVRPDGFTGYGFISMSAEELKLLRDHIDRFLSTLKVSPKNKEE